MMRSAICVLAILVGASAAPGHLEFDWSKIKPMDVFVETLPLEKPDISSKVVNGSEVVPNSIPYQVAIIMDGSSFCGGSLISRDWVLTAAHCTVHASYVQVILGAHNVKTSEATQVTATSRAITVHPDYNQITTINDISLIRLPSSVTLTPAIQVVTLAPASSGTFEGSTALLSGWGRISDASATTSPTLQSINLTVISNAVCQSAFKPHHIPSSAICTSGADGVGACNGDSGGPLVVKNVQVGLVSFGSNLGCEASTPTVYTRVSSFRAWISSIAGI